MPWALLGSALCMSIPCILGVKLCPLSSWGDWEEKLGLQLHSRSMGRGWVSCSSLHSYPSLSHMKIFHCLPLWGCPSGPVPPWPAGLRYLLTQEGALDLALRTWEESGPTWSWQLTTMWLGFGGLSLILGSVGTAPIAFRIQASALWTDQIVASPVWCQCILWKKDYPVSFKRQKDLKHENPFSPVQSS
jgi:hypothetical protein